MILHTIHNPLGVMVALLSLSLVSLTWVVMTTPWGIVIGGGQ